MNIIILGGTGYLGKKLIFELAQENVILCLTHNRKTIEGINKSDSVFFCEVDQLNTFLQKSEQRYDILINVSCKYETKDTQFDEIMDANVFSPVKVLATCLEYNVNNVVTIDTGLPNCFNTYSYSKSKFAELGRWYCELYKGLGKSLQFKNILLENFYGSDEPKNRFIVSTIEKLKNGDPVFLTEGSQKRDFIHIDDVVRNLRNLVLLDYCGGYVDIPLGTGENISIKELVEYLKEVTNSSSELRFGAIPKRENEPDTVADITFLVEHGMKNKYSWKTGLKKVVLEL